jgi:predicted ester cyclase
MSEANKAVIRRIVEEVWHQGNLSVIDELYAPNYVGQSPPEMMHGPKGYKECVIKYRSASPDIRFTIEDMVAEGDKVAARWTIRGTHTGEGLGMAPTGRRWTQSATSLFRLAEGKLVEEWSNVDMLGMLQQIGAVKLPGQAKG